MFLTLLVVTFFIAALVSFVVARLFDRSLRQILGRLVAEDLSTAWHRYIVFAIYVVGISGGVRIWSLEQYIMPRERNAAPLTLNADRWTLEVYRTVIGTLQSVAWMLLVFFAFALIAYVVVRGLEMRQARRREGDG
jgi:membrane protease YdiL (CAAX protease family)